MSVSLGLLYFLLILLPTQLGRHFFFPFSLIAGIRSDYLTPTIYLTDIVIFCLIIVGLFEKWRISTKFEARNSKQYQNSNKRNSKLFGILDLSHWNLFRISNLEFRIFILFIYYLLFNVLFIAANKGAALYTFIKVVEYVLLGTIIMRVKPKMSTVCAIFAFDVLYVSFIAVGQFVLQRSMGGIFWFLGERTFYASTPGIAAVPFFGRLLLRPYATFPHPNVLGGFLAVALPLLLFWFIKQKKEMHVFIQGVYIASFLGGMGALFLSFSRSAWLVFLAGLSFRAFNSGNGFFAGQKKEILLVCFYLLILFSVVIPLSIPSQQESFVQRKNLLQASIQAVLSQPLYGVGLNNSVIHLSVRLSPQINLSIFQPVHNIYMLFLVETGLIGFAFLLFFFALLLTRSLRVYPVICITLLQLFSLGFFDHYLVTIQQGQLLFTLFASLGMYKCFNRNKK